MEIVKSVDVRGFRGIRGFREPLELGRFNVLISRNCSGKTVVLQALYLVAMPFYGFSIPPYDMSASDYIEKLVGGRDHLIYGYSGTATIDYRLGVGGELKNVPYGYSPHTFDVGRIDNLQVSISPNGVEVKTKISSKEVEISLTGDNYVQLIKSLNPRSPTLAIYIPNDSNTYELLHSYVCKNIDGVVSDELHTKVFKYLTGVIYDRFTEVIPRRNELYVRKEVRGTTSSYVRLKDIGEGVKRFTLTYLTVEHLKPPLILWDDVEVSLHPNLLETILKWLADSGRQVVIATHSIDVLKTVIRIEPKDARVILLRKDNSDVVHHKTLELNIVKEILNKGLDLRVLIDTVIPFELVVPQ